SSSRPRSVTPSSRAPARNPGSVTTSRTASAAAHESGLPPNVPPSPPGGTASMTSAPPGTPAGGRPPPIDFPKTVMAGSGPAHPGLHLVVHPEDPVPPAELLQLRRVVGRHREEPTLALHRLEDDARDRRGVDVGLEEVLQGGDRVVGRDAVVRVRGGRAV